MSGKHSKAKARKQANNNKKIFSQNFKNNNSDVEITEGSQYLREKATS
jgi:hypothetical protein